MLFRSRLLRSTTFSFTSSPNLILVDPLPPPFSISTHSESPLSLPLPLLPRSHFTKATCSPDNSTRPSLVASSTLAQSPLFLSGTFTLALFNITPQRKQHCSCRESIYSTFGPDYLSTFLLTIHVCMRPCLCIGVSQTPRTRQDRHLSVPLSIPPLAWCPV